MATKRWTLPYTIGTATSISEADFRIAAADLDATLLDNNWEAVTVAGEIEDLATINLPAIDSSAGFKVYRYVDSHSAMGEIYMRIGFTLSKIGFNFNSSAARGIKFKVEVSNSLDFTPTRTFYSWCPSSNASGANSYSPPNTAGESFCCRLDEYGFYGLVHGAGAQRGHSTSYDTNRYAFFSIFIQRNLDPDMNVIPGFSVFGPHGGDADGNLGGWNSSQMQSWQMKFISDDFYHNSNQSTHGAKPFGTSHTLLPGGSLQISPVFTQTPEVKQVPFLVTYVNAQMEEGTQFEAETLYGTFNFIALGQDSSIFQDYTNDVVNSRVAMVWQ